MRSCILILLCSSAMIACRGSRKEAEEACADEVERLEWDVKSREGSWDQLCKEFGEALVRSRGEVPWPYLTLFSFILESCVLPEDVPPGTHVPETFLLVRDHYLEWRDRWWESGLTLPQGHGLGRKPLRWELPPARFGADARCASAVIYLYECDYSSLLGEVKTEQRNPQVCPLLGEVKIEKKSLEICWEEGLSSDQLRCILHVRSAEDLRQLRQCPAIAEKTPSWLIFPPE